MCRRASGELVRGSSAVWDPFGRCARYRLFRFGHVEADEAPAMGNRRTWSRSVAVWIGFGEARESESQPLASWSGLPSTVEEVSP